MPFTFKQFHIDDRGCGMPVSTDGVILGAWAPLEHAKRILDIGAGSGLLSLMAAQRTSPDNSFQSRMHGAHITAVELDDSAAIACQRNFAASPWATRLQLEHCSIQEFSHQQQSINAPQFEHIICNPPYFDHGPQSESDARARARHTGELSFSLLLNTIQQLLRQDGSASLILPTQSEARFMAALDQTKLVLTERVAVSSVRNKSANRLLLLLNPQENCPDNESLATVKHSPQMTHSELIIRESDGQYSEAMRSLTQGFYLKG